MTDTKDMIHIKYLVQLIWLYLLNNVENINNKKRTAFMFMNINTVLLLSKYYNLATPLSLAA